MGLFILSAVSGTGKSTLARSLVAGDDNWRVSVSHTTRMPRGDERDGHHYHFRPKDEFLAMIEANKFIEWATYVGQYYGTAVDTVQKAIEADVDLLFDIEINGARQIKAAYPSAHAVFLLPPSFEVLKERLLGRATDDLEAVYRRLRRGLVEFEQAPMFDHVIVNDRLSETMAALNIIRQGLGHTLPSEAERLAQIVEDLDNYLSKAAFGEHL